MKSYPFLLILGILLHSPLLSGQEEKLVKICGQVKQYENLPMGKRLRFWVAQLTQFRPLRKDINLQGKGDFCVELPLYYFQEVRLSYLGETIPLLVGPGDELYLEIDALRLSQGEHPWACIRVEGDRALTNRQLITFWGNWREERSRLERISAGMDPVIYKERQLQELNSMLGQLREYRRHYFMNDTVYDWAQQYLNYTVARNLFQQVLRHGTATEQQYLPHQMVSDNHFDTWEKFRQMNPEYALSWAYRMFLSTNINYLNFFSTLQLAPDYLSKSKAERKEFDYVYSDTIIMASIDWLEERPSSGFRTHALALALGNYLELPMTARLVEEADIEQIPDKELRRRIREKYELSRSREVEFNDTERLVQPPDTVQDVVAWAGREFAGSVVLLDFWATWCGRCIYSIENDLPQLVEVFRDQPFVVLLVGIASERNFLIDRANRFAVEALHLFPTQAQEVFLQEQHALKGLPRYMLLNKQGELVDDRAPKPGPELVERIEAFTKS